MNWKSLSWKLLILIVLGGILFLWLIKAPIMSYYLTKKIGVPVSVGSISMWPSQTTIHRFKVLNPPGFKTPTAFEAKKTKINYRFHNLFGTPSEIDRIEIDDIFLNIELLDLTGSQNNWTAIGNRMPADEEKKNPHEVLIHTLSLNNMTVLVQGFGLKQKTFTRKIDHLEFHEIDSQRGFPTKELIQAIFQGAGLQDFIQEMFNPGNLIKPLVPGIPSPFGEKE